MQLLSSPLQGFTDFRFRNLHNKYFGGINVYYAPYMKMDSGSEIKNSYKRDILPENNSVAHLVPQIMTKSADEFMLMAKYIADLGYKELNWNLGCPYPMVTKRGMGSGLIKNTELVDQILTEVYSQTDLHISVKMRLGYEETTESFELIKILNKYPLSALAIHARLGKQMYKGDVDIETFNRLSQETKHKVIYNGDINSFENYNRIKEQMPQIDTFMLGRAVIADPYLSQKIKTNNSELPNNFADIFAEFHAELLEQYSHQLSGDKHIILKMYSFWEYFRVTFSDPELKRYIKKMKKVNAVVNYSSAVNDLLNTYRDITE